MSFVSDLTPVNLLEEREKFFKDFNYNPQFVYVREFTSEELYAYGFPSEKYFECVKNLLAAYPQQPKEGAKITQETDVSDRVTQLLSDLEITHPLDIKFSSELISRCSINKERIVFRLPIEFSEEDFHGLMNHEIQTHLLRSLNNQKQPWYKQAVDRYQKLEREITEEGMANLHSFIEQTDKGMRRSWLNYAAIYLGQRLSFTETFQELLALGIDEHKAWYATVRTKRGLQDTSHPGGNTKGLVYLKGSVQVWNWLLDSEHDPHDLYIGRVSLSEVEEKTKIAETTDLLYPTFLEDLDQYRRSVNQIAEINQFELLR